MTTGPAELNIVNQHIFPLILGERLLVDRPASAIVMGYGEAAMFEAYLSHLRPQCSIEVGTETGVTLATIARHSKRTISIDIDPAVKARLAPRFPNVEFLTGSSHDVLPIVLERLAAEGVTPDFIFVDGDHSADGVRRDLEFILSIRPTRAMTVFMHDSFNPGCRQGIRAAQWARSPWCHFVELDFVPGILHPNANCRREMWGGLALACFLPTERKHELVINASHEIMFNAALSHSVYTNPGLRPAR